MDNEMDIPYSETAVKQLKKIAKGDCFFTVILPALAVF